MNRIRQLLQNYSSYISLPWREDVAAAQRVVVCVYQENLELQLRARIDEFELATRGVGHNWALFDLTDTFADWLVAQRYAKNFFDKPQFLFASLPRYRSFLAETFKKAAGEQAKDKNCVIALMGTGSLFGFVKIKDLLTDLAPMVQGRLLVFFPGNYENNNYRLLNGYDGWNYLAVPITADSDFERI